MVFIRPACPVYPDQHFAAGAGNNDRRDIALLRVFSVTAFRGMAGSDGLSTPIKMYIFIILALEFLRQLRNSCALCRSAEILSPA